MGVIGLAMLVRDEERSLPATLAAVLPLIDTYTIVDTGSTDRTIDVARKILDTEGIRGQIIERPWVGFAHNRTELLKLAAGTCDYHLCLDADLIVHHDPDLFPARLDADAYMIRFAGDFRMSLPLLLRDGPDWRWVGAAHPYLDTHPGCTIADLPGLELHETRTSSPRTDKIEQDARALEAELSPRTIFYLAQSYRDLGHAREAADLYRLRIRLSATSPEDVFWSCYQEGLLRLDESLERGTVVLLEAYQRRPTRAEPLWRLAREYRLRGQAHVALLYAREAAALPMPDDRGFVLAWVHEWGALVELGLCLRALGRHDEARAVFADLADRRIDDAEASAFVADQLTDLTRRQEVPA